MGILSGLEKFGFKSADKIDLFEDETAKKAGTSATGETKDEVPTEEFFLLDKMILCPICDKKFKTKMVKSGKAKRLEPDEDLRPRYQYIDTLKYGITACPNCGYTAMDNQFAHITAGQRKLVRETVCSQFKADFSHQDDVIYSYETALERYQLALLNAVVKKGKNSEKAYICLKIAWLYRGYAESLGEEENKDEAKIKACREAEEEYYKESYEGFMKAITNEMFPICGMEQSTVDYLLAYMSLHFKKYDVASRFVSELITSHSASRKMKDKALELKERIIEEYKNR